MPDNKSQTAARSFIGGQRVKPTYETPVVLPLGELVKGSGNCTSGSSPTGGGGNCKAGSNAVVNNCIDGGTPLRNCNTGGTK